MVKALPTRFVFVTALIMIMGFLFYATAGFFLQDHLITAKVVSSLQRSLQGTGLRITIGNVHWAGFNRIQATRIILRDMRDSSIPFQTEKLNLNLDLLTFIANRFHPESSLREVELVNPRFELRRSPDGTWNFNDYLLPQKKKKPMQLQISLRIRNGVIKLQDYEYGRHIVRSISGKVSLNRYSLLTWTIKGASDFNERMQWSSKGKCRIDQLAGTGEFIATHVAIDNVIPFIPMTNEYQIHSGFTNVNLQFAWNKEEIWLRKGAASFFDAAFILPRVHGPFSVKRMEVEFSPVQCRIDNAYIVHKRTVIKASGLVNNKTNSLKAELSAEQIDLTDFERVFPAVNLTTLQGEADLRLTIAGSLDNPVLNGELFINKGQFGLAGQRVLTRISGRMMIRENNLKIQRLEGTWNNSLLGITGNINNLFNPNLDLRIYGSGLTFQSDELALLRDRGLSFCSPVDFNGTITGKPNAPKILGTVSVRKLLYKAASLDNLKFKLEWDGATDNLKVLEAGGDLWEGHLTAKGEVRINSKGINWQISGQVSDLNLSSTAFSTNWGLKGRVSSNLIFKGNWRKGTPFQWGSIFGIFQGENLTYQDAAVEETNGVFNWIDGSLNIDSIQAKIGQGMVYGHLSWSPNEVTASINAENIPIQQLLPDKNTYPLDGLFNGNLSFTGPPQDLTAKINGVFSGITWAGRQVGTISGVLNYNDQEFITEALVTTDMGDFNLAGRLNLAEAPWLSLNIMSNNIQLDGLPKCFPEISTLQPNGNATINCTINGQLDNPDIQGEISLIAPVLGPLQMEQGVLKVAGKLRELSITEFNLRNRDSIVSITGKIGPNQLDLYLKGSAIQLEMMRLVYDGNTVNGTIDLQGNITGDPLNPVLSGQITGKELGFGTFTFQQLSAQIIWQSGIIEIESARLSKEQTVLAVNGKIAPTKEWPLNLNVEVSELSLEDLLNYMPKLPPDFKAAGKLSGFMKLTGDINNPRIQINGGLSQGVFNTLPVSGEFDLSYNNHRVNIERFVLNQGTGVLSANGIWEADTLTRVNISLQSFPCEVLNPFIDHAYKLTGAANAFIFLEWSDSEVSGGYHVTVNNLALNEYLLGDLNVEGDLYKRGISIGEGKLSRMGGSITAQGDIPWPEGLLQWLKLPVSQDDKAGNLDMAVNIRNIPADFIRLFLDDHDLDFKVLKGSINGELNLGGSLTKPEILGNINLDDVTLNIAELPRFIEDFQASVFFNGVSAIINKARGNYGQGKFNLSGSVDYAGLKINSMHLGVTGSNIYYKNPYFNGYGNLNLELNGPPLEPEISGDIEIFNSRFGVISYRMTKDSPSIWNPTLDVGIRTRKNVRYRQMGLADVTVSGKIRVQGKINNPKLEGEATTREGIITLYSRTFKVDHGKAIFKYEEGFLPYIDVSSSLRIPKAEIFLTAKGQVGSDIAINLTSEPYMPGPELFSMLNWPRLDDEQESTTIDDIVNGNISLVTDTIFGDFLYQLRNALDLDYLYLEPNYQQNDLRFSVGRNITKDLFLSYSSSFIYTSTDNWELDYQITPRLSLGGTFSSLDETSWRLIYRFNF